MQEDNPLLNAEPVKDKGVLDISQFEDKSVETPPTMENPDWSEYVLQQLEPDEMWNGLPTADGLRRIANKLLGDIVESVPIVVQAPSPNNDNHATVCWRLSIRWSGNPVDIRIFGDVADVYPGNTPQKEFAVHASATAATKAEGRALRKALQLKRVLSAEEASDVPPEDPTKINKDQINFIQMMCERNDINVLKLLGKSKLKIKKIEEVPYTMAVKINKYLSNCQNGKDDQGRKVEIPADIQGYDSNWRQNEGSI